METGAKGINCTLRNGNQDAERAFQVFDVVLIVPCGMETRDLGAYAVYRLCINCTLRNGNEDLSGEDVKFVTVLIVPCGMETCHLVDNFDFTIMY